ncbi:LysR family transcriptional regulator [Lampropedia puyangensis]|uniref:LysR family transcriptional regulator n=1 Tax=Lampropedia puyangensis TaxID=1330072 RepID=A0A4S8EQM6_9BURK|nr:LysR family transcriptional regulator [Lampropedia puyangensis]THT96400.1 LysR family transcriptional regulator [Lampropedia puyangensis]
MWTYKQLEAVYWIHRLGGFAAAAEHLHTTQSAISRRVRELEEQVDTSLFDRTARAAQLTEKGQELVVLAGQLLAQRDAALEQFLQNHVVQRRVRIGVTELTAMTWLSQWVTRIQRHYPKLELIPHVDTSVALHRELLHERLDLVVVPDAFSDAGVVTTPLTAVANVWAAKPGLVPQGKLLEPTELTQYRRIVQGDRSGSGIYYARWLQKYDLHAKAEFETSNLLALIGLLNVGVGIGYLPRQCLEPFFRQGYLEEIALTDPLPPMHYVALQNANHASGVISSIAALAQECCDYSSLFQHGGKAASVSHLNLLG